MSKLNLSLKQNFIELIAQHTGIKIRPSDQSTLDEKIFSRIKALKLNSPQDYYNLLSASTKKSLQEWENLAILLTNLESYFFRDKGQFTLLRNQLIPEIITRKQQQKTIKICSAGCSTGQEPYSIGILLHQLIPDIEQWNIAIFGLDINNDALNKARKGVYNSWSFRSVDPEIKTKYFTMVKEEYHLADYIKKMVRFKHCNLVNDSLNQIDVELNSLDLIICRNVFIYFKIQAVNEVVRKFYDLLNPCGFFLSGHAEVAGDAINKFQIKTFPESLVYQRPENDLTFIPSVKPQFLLNTNVPIKSNDNYLLEPPKVAVNNLIPEVKPIALNPPLIPTYTPINPVINSPVLPQKPEPLPQKISEKQVLEEADKLFKQKSYQLALEKVQELLKVQPNNLQANQLIAQIYANQGQYEQASNYCMQALKINSFAVIPHYILSHIADENGDIQEAKRLLKKIIYLDPNFIPAYFELSYIYQQESDLDRLEKTKEVALNLLKKLPQDSTISELGNQSVKQLIYQLENL
jgi:chemotaxis protein methyltransferase CheR